MIDVQMGAHDEVDFVGVHAERLHVFEIGLVEPVPERCARTFFVIAAAGVDDRSPARRTHDIGMMAEDEAASRLMKRSSSQQRLAAITSSVTLANRNSVEEGPHLDQPVDPHIADSTVASGDPHE
jgi:hypothetical protein